MANKVSICKYCIVPIGTGSCDVCEFWAEEDNKYNSDDEVPIEPKWIKLDHSHPLVQASNAVYIEQPKNNERVKKAECAKCHVEKGDSECSDCKLEQLWEDQEYRDELARQRELKNRGEIIHKDVEHYLQSTSESSLGSLQSFALMTMENVFVTKCLNCCKDVSDKLPRDKKCLQCIVNKECKRFDKLKKCKICQKVDIPIIKTYCFDCKHEKDCRIRREKYKKRKLLE